MMKVIFSCLCLACANACISTRRSNEPPPLYPSTGFGRIGCFAGASLQQFYNGPSEHTDSAARAGPWLVLDSLTNTEAQRILPKRPSALGALLQGTIVYPDEPAATVVGPWQRPTADSVILSDSHSQPPVTWRLRWLHDDLIGEAALLSDLAVTLPNGRVFSPTHYWHVDLMRVPCRLVPHARS